MHVPVLLLCFATLEARKQRDKTPSPLPKNLDKIESIDDTYDRPVDFMHVYREGFGDKDYKQPIHLLERDMIKPKNKEHAQELLQKTNKKNVEWLLKDETLMFNSPRDELLYYKKKHKTIRNASTLDDKRHVYDFLRMLERNIAHPVIETRGNTEADKSPSELVDQSKIELRKNISDMFELNSFDVKQNDKNKKNWTTCDEFAEHSLFHSQDIVNTEWLPFYLWSKRGFHTAVVHRFTYPTRKRVTYYKTSFGPFIKNIDWTQPKLLLKERREILLISSDRLGLFYGIPDQEVPTPGQGKVILLPITLRIKIHSPYVAMMYCDEFYSTIMAERGTEPITDTDKTREASTLGFRGLGVPVYQDLENEKMLAQMAELRKLEDEARKIIKIKQEVGDVDIAVKH